MFPTPPPRTDDATSLPAHLKAGHVLTEADVEQLQGLLSAKHASGSWARIESALAITANAIGDSLHSMVRNFAGATSLGNRMLDSSRWFLLIACLISLPLVLNPGYFSHDELQWLAFADKPALAEVPWSAWFDFAPFQYRPLTFNLWLLLSHFIGYQPILMHMVRVLLGLAAAWLLRAVLLQFEVKPHRASMACLVFLLTPYTVYTHGWVGTIGDSLCLIFMLMGADFVLSRPTHSDSWALCALHALPIAALTTLALMSKESAVVFPAVVLVVALRRRDRVVAAAFAASAGIVLVYLSLRLQTILFSHDVASGYHWSIANLPARVAEYSVFPFLTGHFEIFASRRHLTNGLALICLAIFTAALASTGWRRFAVFWLGWLAALGPVLILSVSANHYGYLAAAYACGFVAAVWNIAKPLARLAFSLAAIVAVIHGYQEIREIRHIGRVQNHLYADLTPLIAQGTEPISIKAQRNREDFILQRLLHEIPSYHRIPIASRVTVIPYSRSDLMPDYLMSGNGHLSAPRPPLP